MTTETMTTTEAAALLGVTGHGLARMARKHRVGQSTAKGCSWLYDVAAIHAIAAERAAHVCVYCGAHVAYSTHVTCGASECVQRRKEEREHRRAEAQRAFKPSRRTWESIADPEPRADEVARAAIVDAWRATSWRYPKDRLRQTAIMAECNRATILGVLRAMGETDAR